MRVILLRHGIATDRDDPACPPDPERPLTPEGRARTEAAVLGLRAIGVRPGAVLTSPYVRAAQTAAIASRVLDAPAPEPRDELLPAAPPSRLAELLRRRTEDEILCAGHEPHLGLALAVLVAGDAEPDLALGLKKAGAACVETGRAGVAGGELLWLLPPKLLRRLGASS